MTVPMLQERTIRHSGYDNLSAATQLEARWWVLIPEHHPQLTPTCCVTSRPEGHRHVCSHVAGIASEEAELETASEIDLCALCPGHGQSTNEAEV